MIRTINTKEITKNVKEMCIEANHYLSPDMDAAMKKATAEEKSELGKKILNQLQENLKIAGEEMIPICQDTGMAVFFVEIGQDVHFEGDLIEDAINEGVRQGYVEGYLRKSVVADPILKLSLFIRKPQFINKKRIEEIIDRAIENTIDIEKELKECYIIYINPDEFLNNLKEGIRKTAEDLTLQYLNKNLNINFNELDDLIKERENNYGDII